MSVGTITGNTVLLKKFTAKVNAAQNKAWALLMKDSGFRWQFDDANHTKDPIIYTNLVQGQKDYHFSTDEQGNVILDIYRIGILPSATATLYQDIYPIDAQSGRENGLTTDNTTQGVPYQYDKTGLGIFLDFPSSYNATNGMKLYIDREGYYFTTSDTTKTPGFAGLFHEYCVIVPSAEFAVDKVKSNKNNLLQETIDMEKAMTGYYARRAKDERQVMTGKKIKYI